MLVEEWRIGPYEREVSLPQPFDGRLTNATYGSGSGSGRVKTGRNKYLIKSIRRKEVENDVKTIEGKPRCCRRNVIDGSGRGRIVGSQLRFLFTQEKELNTGVRFFVALR